MKLVNAKNVTITIVAILSILNTIDFLNNEEQNICKLLGNYLLILTGYCYVCVNDIKHSGCSKFIYLLLLLSYIYIVTISFISAKNTDSINILGCIFFAGVYYHKYIEVKPFKHSKKFNNKYRA